VFPYGVQFVDVRARRQQQPGRGAQFGEGDRRGRGGQQGGAATGEQAEDEIGGTQIAQEGA